MTGMEWKSTRQYGLPKEDGLYLVTTIGLYPKVLSFSNDLSKVDKDDFEESLYKGVKGFYQYDREYGYLSRNDIRAWIKIESYKGE